MITFFAVFVLIVSISSVTIKYEFTSCETFDQILIDNTNIVSDTSIRTVTGSIEASSSVMVTIVARNSNGAACFSGYMEEENCGLAVCNKMTFIRASYECVFADSGKKVVKLNDVDDSLKLSDNSNPATFYAIYPYIIYIERTQNFLNNGYTFSLSNIYFNISGSVTLNNAETGTLTIDNQLVSSGSSFPIDSDLNYKNPDLVRNFLVFTLSDKSFPNNNQTLLILPVYQGYICYFQTNEPMGIMCPMCKPQHYRIDGDTNLVCYNETTKPTNYYLDSSNSNEKKWKYKKCHTNCTTCETTSDNCLSCSTDYSFLENSHTCLTCTDPDYFIPPGQNYCVICDESCNTCEHLDSCLTCKDGYFFVEDQSTSLCMLYSSITNIENYCKKDTQTYLLLANRYYYEDNNERICIDNCSDNTMYILEGTMQCVLCNGDHQVIIGDTCYECSTNCKTCENSIDQCTSCYSSYALFEDQPNTCILENSKNLDDYCYSSSLDSYLKLPHPYIDKSGKKQCVDSCAGEGKIQMSDTKECIDSCNQNGYYQVQNDCYTCDKSCSTCSNEATNCGACNTGYYFVSDQNNKCILESNISDDDYCFDQSSNLYRRLPYYYYLDNGKKICTATCGASLKYQIDGTYKCVDSCPEQTFNSNYICYSCYSTCKTCSHQGDSLNHLCSSCLDNYQENPFINTNCYQPCTNGVKFYVDTNYDYHCLSSGQNCPSTYPYLVKDTNQCVQSCEDRYCKECTQTTLYELKNICYSQCPSNYSPSTRKTCELKGVSSPVEEGDNLNYNSTLNSSTFIENIKETVSISIDNANDGKTTIIKHEEYIYSFYSSSETTSLTTDSPKINLGKCEDLLRDAYVIGDDEEIYIAVIDYTNTSKIVNRNQYKVYDNKGNELDLSVCDNTTVTVTSKLNPEYEGIDIEYMKELQEQGINIFDPEDPIYTDRCLPLSQDGKDVPLNERQSMGYNNLSLCEDGCTVSEINYTTYEVTCECSPQTDDFNSILEENEVINQIKDLLNNYNFYMFGCYHNFERENSLKTNYGNWIFISCIGSYFMLILVFYIFQLPRLYSSMNIFVAAPSIKNSHIDTGYTKAKDKMFYKTTNTGMLNSASDELDDSHNKDTSEDSNQMSGEELNSLDYEEALDSDKRSFCSMLIDIVIENQIFMSTIASKSIFNPISIRLLMLIFTISAFFFFNGIFFTEEYVSNRYTSNKKLDLLYIFTNEIKKSIYSSILGLALSKIIMLVTSVNGHFMKILRDKEDRNKSITLCKLIKSYKKKLLILLIIIVLLDIVFWYFISIFCTIFNNNQRTWIESSFISIGIYFILTLFFCFLGTILRYLGLRNESSTVFKASSIILEIL